MDVAGPRDELVDLLGLVDELLAVSERSPVTEALRGAAAEVKIGFRILREEGACDPL